MEKGEFARLLEEYMAEKRKEMTQTYNRVLPSGELIFNRFDKAKYLGCGEGSSVYDTSVIMGDVEIGEHVWVGPYTILEGSSAKLTIGNFVSIAAGVMVYTHDSTKYYVSGGKETFQKAPVTIGNCTSIGTLSMISCGVSIGDHCVIGAYSFVKDNVPDYSIAAGIPAKVIGRVRIQDDGSVSFDYL